MATPDENAVEDATGALAGLLGRGNSGAVPGAVAELAAGEVLDAAIQAVGRPVRAAVLTGRAERAVVLECADADLLILARDGDRSRLGPHSLGKHTRFVVDYAPCPVLLVWPEPAPGVGSIPASPV